MMRTPLITTRVGKRAALFVAMLGVLFGGLSAVSTPRASATGLPTQLANGATLAVGQGIASANGTFSATMAPDGNFVVKNLTNPSSTTQIWSTALSPAPGSGATLLLQGDGNLGLYNSSHVPVWWPSTAPDPNDRLVLSNTGVLQIISSGGLLLWTNASNGIDTRGVKTVNTTSSLGFGQQMGVGSFLKTVNGLYTASLNAGCQLVVTRVADSHVMWNSPNTYNAANCRSDAYVNVQAYDGNVAVWPGGGQPSPWFTLTAPDRHDSLQLNNDGSLSVMSAGGLVLWTNAGGLTLNANHILGPGATLHVGGYLLSQNETYTALLRSDGNFVVVNNTTKATLWSTAVATAPGSGAALTFQGDGNLSLTNTAGTPVWWPGTAPEPNDRLFLSNTGQLQIYSTGGLLLWTNTANGVNSSGLKTANHTSTLGYNQRFNVGQSLSSSDLAYRASINSSCQLEIVKVATSTIQWTSPISALSGGCSGGYFTVQSDGNVALFQDGTTARWWTGTAPYSGNRVTLESSGVLVEYAANNAVLWSSNASIVPPTGGGGAVLLSNQSLPQSSQLVSTNAAYVAKISNTCQLVVTRVADSHVMWTSSNTAIQSGCSTGSVGFGITGDVTLYSAPGTVAWHAGSSPGSGTRLVLTTAGTLVEQTVGGVNAWVSGAGVTGNTNDTLLLGGRLNGGSYLLSGGGAYKALMQTDGNFVIYKVATGKAIWSTGTYQYPGGYLLLRQSDSQIVIYDANNVPRWASWNGGIATKLVMQADGNLGFFGLLGPLWSSMQGQLWHMPTNVGVYAYPDPQANVMNDGWPILGITGGLGTTSAPFVDTSQSSDFFAGLAIQASGRRVPWQSYWTVTGPGCSATPYWAGINGRLAGRAVAQKIDAYATGGLRLKPDWVIFDPEGYPDNHSGLDCNLGSPTQTDVDRFWAMVQNWCLGLADVDPSLPCAFYATQSEFNAYRLTQVTNASGGKIPGFLAVAFGYSGNDSSPLINPSPVGGIPYGSAQIAASNIKGIIAFYAGVPFSVECSRWTGVAAQVIANWGAAFNTLQFDPGRSCTASGTIPR